MEKPSIHPACDDSGRSRKPSHVRDACPILTPEPSDPPSVPASSYHGAPNTQVKRKKLIYLRGYFTPISPAAP